MSADPEEVLSRPAPPPDRTLAYGDGPEHVFDVRMPPAGVPQRTLVVFLHGGFWRAAYDRSHVGPLAADLASRGYPVVCLEYRRTGQLGGGWPGTLVDVATGVAAIPGLLGIPGPPIVAGHSAGGHLALWSATQVPTCGVLALAPVADLVEGYRLGLGAGAVGALLGGGPERVPERYAAADPAGLPAPPVPAVLLHGTGDDVVPVSLSQAYARRPGGRVRLVEIPGAGHFDLIDPLAAAWPTVVDALRTLGA